MAKPEFKSFAELYTDSIKKIATTKNVPVEMVLDNLSAKEAIIRKEYETTLIMDEQYYINKFVGRL